MSSRELMLLLSSFIRANNILVHRDINDILDLSRYDIPKMARATIRAPTAEDELFVEKIELWATGQEHDEPIIPKCFTRDNLRQKTSNLGSSPIICRIGQEDCSSLPSELVCLQNQWLLLMLL